MAEQNPIDPDTLFALRQVANPAVLEAGTDRVVGSVGDHRRTFELDRTSGELTVTDELTGSGTHRVESRLHLARGVPVDRLKLCFWGEPAEVSVEEGWVSDRYGVRERAPVLRVQGTVELPARFGYTFSP